MLRKRITNLRKKLINRKNGKRLLIVVLFGGIAYFGYSRYVTYTYPIIEKISRSPVSEVDAPRNRTPYMLIISTVGGILIGTVLSSRSIPPVEVEGSIPPVEVYPSTPTTTRPTWVTLIYFGMGYVVGIWKNSPSVL